MTDQIREHITDIRQLAEEMALTAEGVPGMNLTLSKARIASVCRAFLAATAPRPEEKDMVLVPREPTKEMVVAAYGAQQAVGALTIQKIYRAMLSASSPQKE